MSHQNNLVVFLCIGFDQAFNERNPLASTRLHWIWKIFADALDALVGEHVVQLAVPIAATDVGASISRCNDHHWSHLRGLMRA